MPATEHAFTDPLPERIYVDADLLITAIVDGEPHHPRSGAFFERLVVEGGCVLYLSALSWLEFANVVTREQFRRSLPQDVQQRFQLDRWQHPIIREAYVPFFVQSLETLLSQFTWEEVMHTQPIRTAALNYVATYGMRSYDAAHLAAAVSAGVYDIASFDETFRRVDGLQLWNDLIHRGVPS